MTALKWIEIENFKGFGNAVRIPLAHPCVLIGPNNSGKTTVLQALSLWSAGIREWTLKRRDGDLASDESAVVNRLALMDVPVGNTRLLWHDADTGGVGASAPILLTLGLILPTGRVCEVRLEILPHSAESIRCRPADSCRADDELMRAASELRFGLLHPMSGIASAVSTSTDEPLVAPGRVNVLLGQGQTAQALRNVCYQLWENAPEDWARVAGRMAQVFGCTLDAPVFDAGRGSLFLNYRERGLAHPLEIVLAGRGMQQMLLLLAYLYGHRGGVVLFDEPYAHLEVLRQRQAFTLLRDVADEIGTQIVLATHSEVILDESVETNLVSLVDGTITSLSQRKDIRTTLRNLGVFHFYAAEQKRRLLIVEGATDVSMLKAFARKLGHPAAAVLDDAPFVFYTQGQPADGETASSIREAELRSVDFRQYYATLKRLTPDLRALAIFDSDGKIADDVTVSEDFKILHWSRYEFENYFITPERLEAYIVGACGQESSSLARQAVEEILSSFVFNGDEKMVSHYRASPLPIRESLLAHTKMSQFAEDVLRRFSELSHRPVLMNKGEFYRLILCLRPQDVAQEVIRKLDVLVEMFDQPVALKEQRKQPTVAPKDALKAFLKRNNRIPSKNKDEHIDVYVELLSLICENPSVSLSAIAGALKVSERTVDILISELKAAEVIRRVGGRKYGHWEIMNVAAADGFVNPKVDQ